MSIESRLVAILLVPWAFALSAFGGENDPRKKATPEPITLRNVDRVGLLSETSRAVDRIERGPGPNELVFHHDDGIEIVDDATLEVVRRVADEDRPAFSYSRDGSKTSWLDGTTVVIRDEKTGAIKRIESAGEEDLGQPVLSPDNEVVVVPDIVVDETGGEGEGSVYLRIFEATTGELIRKLTIVDGAYGGLTPVFSPDGKTLAVGNRNYRTNLFDTSTWTLRHELPRSMTHEIAFSPDGALLAAAYTDGTIALWSVESGEMLRTADSGCSRVQSLDWSPAGELLATSGPKGTRIGRHAPNEQRPGKVQLWDPKKLRLLRDLVGVSQSGSVRFTRDGKRLVARFKRDILRPDTKVAVWTTNEQRAADTRPTRALQEPPTEPAKAKDGPLGMTFVSVPKGVAFVKWDGRPGTARRTEIDADFEIAVHAVTQGQWQTLMGENPSHFSREGAGSDKVADIRDEELGQFPVEQVSWDDCQRFLEALNERERGKGWVYRLPTEVEWEYACRGGAKTREESSFHYYFATPTNDLSSKQANFNGGYPGGKGEKGPNLGRTTKVGSYSPNKLGLFDVHGNVWEWTGSRAGEKYVIRGGSWYDTGGKYCQAGCSRLAFPSTLRRYHIGVRLVRVPVGG